jgi:2-oxoglutarate dehydrogenase complex dehydrogenase (E1) component-like enzyme
MKIEIFEKTGEVTIVQMRTAEENNAIALTAITQEKMARMEKERKIQESFSKVLQTLAQKINKAAEDGHHYFYLDWSKSSPKPHNIDWETIKGLSEKLVSIFKIMGYNITVHEYCPQWAEKSGRLGYISISW